MNQGIIKNRIKHFSTVMAEKGLPNTPQKLAIFTSLAAREDHPTAQMIFEEVTQQFPNMSFATVYKNLKKFSDLGLIRELPMKDNTLRYDANLEDHHHIINLDTQEISDVAASEVGAIASPKFLQKFDLDSVSVNFFVRNKL